MADTSWIQKLVRSLLKSLGLKRKLSSAFQTLALIISQIPLLAPWAGVLISIAGWLGIAGFTHAVVDSELKSDKKVPALPTIAAFFNALVVAADTVPALAAYKALFLFLASVLSALSTGTTAVAYASKE